MIEPARPLDRRRLQCYLALVLADILALFAGFWGAGYLYLGEAGLHQSAILAQLVLPIFLTVGLYNGAYSMAALANAVHGTLRALLALFISSAAVVFIAFYTKSSEEFSRFAYTSGMLLAAFSMIWTRAQMRGFVRWRCGPSVVNQLILEDGGPMITLPGSLRISAQEAGIAPDLGDPAQLDRISRALRNFDRVVVSCPPERRANWAIILKGANISGEVLDDAVSQLGAHGARIAGGHGWLRVSIGPLGLRARLAKRGFDLVLAGGGLILLSPILLLVALAIRLEDGGPALFFQRRVGRGNRFFEMFKFRSMAVGRSDHQGEVSTARDDHRITRVGRFIRRTSIDELPQLINVVLGDMSLVGPRPHALGSQAGDKLFWEVDARYWQRHALRPGLTGLAQIRGLRGTTEQESDLAQRLNADLEYLDGWSLGRDAAILVATLRVLIHPQAY
jgi:lipopolysaccharide/colanic/teichoic acid biosynthesis glycosyltransferase